MGKDLFKVLREKCGPNFTTFLSQRTTIVPGDITCENLGVNDTNLLEQMWKEVDIVVNIAATTNFDERYYLFILIIYNFYILIFFLITNNSIFLICRYDVALGINTFGAKHVLNFSKKCNKLKVLLHVSTG